MKRGFVIYSMLVAVLLCWSLLFMLLHWAGGYHMMLISVVAGIVAAIWYACAQLRSGKSCKGLVIFNAIVVVLTLCGLWMKVAHYPGGAVVAIATLGILLPLAIVLNTLKCNSKCDK